MGVLDVVAVEERILHDFNWSVRQIRRPDALEPSSGNQPGSSPYPAEPGSDIDRGVSVVDTQMKPCALAWQFYETCSLRSISPKVASR